MTQITDSDREAAADIWRDYVARVGEIIVEKQMRQGGLDYGLPTRLAEHRIQSTAAMSAEIERLKGMAGKICDGCGSVEHIDTLRAKPGVISCCPDRKLVDAKDLWLEIDQLRREKAEAVELLKNLLPDFTGGIDPIEAEPVVKARAFLGQQEQRT